LLTVPNNTITTISGIIDNELNYNADLLYKVSEKVVKKLVVERQTPSYKKPKFDIDKEFKQFLHVNIHKNKFKELG